MLSGLPTYLILVAPCFIFPMGFIDGQVGNDLNPVIDATSEAILGRLGELPCDITPQIKDDTLLLVLWYKMGSGRPIYTFDARNGDLMRGSHKSEVPGLIERAHFTPDPSPVLSLNNIEWGDEGIYICRVDFQVSPTRYSRVKLKILVAPQKPVIKDGNAKMLQGNVADLNEGSALQLTCEVEGGDPVPKLQWYQNGSLVDETQDGQQVNKIYNTLVFPSLTRHHHLATYDCLAINNNIVAPESTSVQLHLNLRPKKVTLFVPGPMIEGEEYDISCLSTGSVPPAQITWFISGHQVPPEEYYVTKEESRSTSTYRYVAKRQHKGTRIACVAENTNMTSAYMEDSKPIDIKYAPTVNIQLGSSLDPSQLKVGDDVYFECVVDAHPAVDQVDWKHDGALLRQNISSGIIKSNQSLVFQKISKSSRGKYMCMTENELGKAESKDFQLMLKYAPECTHTKKFFSVALGETITFNCTVDSVPPSSKFRWTFNNSVEVIDLQPNVGKRRADVVDYTPMSDLEYGEVACWAENSIAKQKDPCVFEIIKAGPPDPPGNCSVTNLTADSLVVYCREGFNGGMFQQFQLEIYDLMTMTLTAEIVSNHSHFKVKGLADNMEMVILISSVNRKGKSDPIRLEASTLKSAETRINQPGLTNFFPIFGIWISVIISIVLLLLSVLLLWKSKIRSSKRQILDKNAPESTFLKLDNNRGMTNSPYKGSPDILPKYDEDWV